MDLAYEVKRKDNLKKEWFKQGKDKIPDKLLIENAEKMIDYCKYYLLIVGDGIINDAYCK